MKTIFKYIFLAAVALIVAACQEGLDQIPTDEGMGNVRLSISTKEHTRADFTPEELRVRIYDDGNRLVRIYTEDDVIPENIALVAGEYTFKVEARDNDHTTKFKGSEVVDDREKIYYIGEDDVTVTAGGSVTAEVDCDPQHVRVGVILDEDEGENQYLRNVGISLAAMQLTIGNNPTAVDNKKKNDFDTAYAASTGADRLDFGTAISGSTTSYVGEDYAYFLMPEGVETIAWVIAGEHVAPAEDQPATTAEEDSTEGSDSTGSNDGATAPEGVVTKFDRAGQIVVEPGKAYALQFRYSKLPDGSITITVDVDYTVDAWDDQITFKPEPEIKPLAGNPWVEDDENENVYVVGTSNISFEVTSINKIDGFGLNEKKLWDKGVYASGAEDMITVTPEGTDGKKFIVTVNPGFFATLAGGEQDFRFSAYDGTTEVGKFKTTFLNQGLTESTFNMWTNKAEFSAIITKSGASKVEIKYKNVTSDEVNVISATSSGSNSYRAESADPWIERKKDDTNPINKKYTVYEPNENIGFYANNTYEYQLYVDDQPYGPKFTKQLTTTQTIPFGNFEETDLACWGNDTGVAPYWGSGNNSFTEDDPLCRQATFAGMTGNYCAQLSSCAAGAFGVTMLAAGNVFTGTFKKPSTTGTVSFGINYNWEARPTAMKLKYWGDLGIVDRDDKGKNLISGDDEGSIYVAIVDWTDRHKTSSGTGQATGVWSVEDGANAVSEGEIIGYGVAYPTGTTEGDSMVELVIPIYYYDKETKPSKNYTLVISAATSRYGDYMNGCSNSNMYVDDFQWVY